MPNVFLSFLGTGNYDRGNNWLDIESKTCGLENTRYVQLAILNALKQANRLHPGEDDSLIVIAVTTKARTLNWLPFNDWQYGQEKKTKGLRQDLVDLFDLKEFDEYSPDSRIQVCEIPDGQTVDEIWSIFRLVFDRMPKDAKLHLDITHAFRFIPMLGVVLLNYLRLIKEVQIEDIYYGNWEARDELLNAPIYKLTSFVELMDWTEAAGEFVHNGNAASLYKMLKTNEPKGSEFPGKLRDFAMNLLTVRGRSIVTENPIRELRKKLDDELNRNDLHEAVKPILSKVGEKLEPFGKEKDQNGLAGVEWCLEHGLIQQGITLLQEFIITLICRRLKKSTSAFDEREFVRKKLTDNNGIIDVQNWQELKNIFSEVNQYRNDINHGGFVKETKKVNGKELNKPFKARDFEHKLHECYGRLKKIVG